MPPKTPPETNPDTSPRRRPRKPQQDAGAPPKAEVAGTRRKGNGPGKRDAQSKDGAAADRPAKPRQARTGAADKPARARPAAAAAAPEPEAAAAPQLYLISPLGASAGALAPLLAEVLDRVPAACLRLRAGDDAAELGRLADMAREIAHGRDIAVVIEDHAELALRHGLDGVHLTRGTRGLREARKLLGADAIVGAFCGASRHEGLGAGEAGADYVSFGPVGGGGLSLGAPAPLELFAWWSEMIEVPVVAEGGIDGTILPALQPLADFIAIGSEIWGSADPADALAALWNQLRG